MNRSAGLVQSRILVVGPAWIGDMVMAQTLFILLKQRSPEVLLDVLAPPWTLPLLARMPEVNNALPLPIHHGQFHWRERFRIGKALREKRYTKSIILPNSFKSALIPFWANISCRTGFHRECRGLLLNDARRLDKTKYPLMIQRFASLGLSTTEAVPESLPNPQLIVNSQQVAKTLYDYQLTSPIEPVLALCPGAEFGVAKRWPEQYYAELAREKLAQGWQVWLFGSEKDRIIAEKINTITKHACTDLTGKTTLGAAIDLLSLAKIVVTNDSGLMHIAAALNRPVVAIYGATSPQFTPPLTAQAKIVRLNLTCQPCFQRQCPLKHHHCMLQLDPSLVSQAMSQLL